VGRTCTGLACSPSAYARRVRTHATRSTGADPLLLRAPAARHHAMVSRMCAIAWTTSVGLVLAVAVRSPPSRHRQLRARVDRIRQPRVLAAPARMSCSTPADHLFSLRASRLGLHHHYPRD
jgi:hypothetical protein